MIAESMPPTRRARYAAYVQVGAPLGGLMAACADWFLEPVIGWRSVFLLSAAPAFIVAIAVWRWLPESDVWLARGSHRWINRADLRALVPYRALIATLFIVLLINSEAYWFIYSWMPGYLRLVRGLPLRVSDRLIVGMQIGAVAGYAIFGALADRFGRRPVFCTYATLMAVGLLPPTVLWSHAAATPGLIAAAMIVVGFGTGIWSGAGPMISEMLPTAVRNTSLAILLNGTRGLQFFTPLAITALSPRIGFGPTIAFGALFAAAGAASVWALPETRGRRITALDTVA
jgi:MFS family permease